MCMDIREGFGKKESTPSSLSESEKASVQRCGFFLAFGGKWRPRPYDTNLRILSLGSILSIWRRIFNLLGLPALGWRWDGERNYIAFIAGIIRYAQSFLKFSIFVLVPYME